MTFYDVVVFDAAGTLIGRESPHHFEEYFIIAAREVGHTLTVEDVQAAVERRYKDTQSRLGGTGTVHVEAGDRIVIKTPGGGGWGKR